MFITKNLRKHGIVLGKSLRKYGIVCTQKALPEETACGSLFQPRL